MLNKKINHIQINLYEILIVLVFIALGYCLFYKYAFYKTLDIPWFITNITPQFLFLTSLKVIFTGIVFFILGYIIGKIGKNTKVRKAIFYFFATVFIIFTSTLIFLFFTKNNNDLSILNLQYFDFLNAYFVSNFGYLTSLAFRQYNLKLKKLNLGSTIIHKNQEIEERLLKEKLYKYLITMSGLSIFSAYCLQPISLGANEANYLLTFKKEYMNESKIKGSNDIWYLIEVMGDKVLLINSTNKIKIIEYKDLDFIQKK